MRQLAWAAHSLMRFSGFSQAFLRPCGQSLKELQVRKIRTSNFVDILKGQPEGLVGRPGGWDDGVKGVQEGGSRGVTLLTLDLPALVP